MATLDYVKLYREKGKEAWGRLNSRQRWVFGGIGAALVVAFAALIAGFGSGKGGMTPLKGFTGDPQIAIEKLAVYQIHAHVDGGELKVPLDREERAAFILAAARMFPNSKEHYKFLDESSLTSTDGQMRAQMIVRREQILAETIMAMDFVAEAEVVLTRAAEPWSFPMRTEKLEAKGNVTLRLRDQPRLHSGQVAAIAHLVGNSLEVLSPERVSIIDTNGRLYRYDPEWKNANTYIEMKESLELQTARNAERALQSKYKPAAVAMIYIDANHKNINKEEYEPGEGFIPHEQTSTKEAETTTKLGAAGGEANIGRDEIHDPASGTVLRKEREEKALSNRVKGKTVTQEVQSSPIPDYNKSSITVTLSDEYKDELSDAQLDKFRGAIAKATGIPDANVSVLVLPPPEIMLGAGSGLGGIAGGLLSGENLVKGVLLLLAVGAFVALMIMLKKSAPKPLTLVDEEMVEEQPEAMPEVPRLPPVDQLEGNLVRERVIQLIKKNPSAAANLIKRWMILGK